MAKKRAKTVKKNAPTMRPVKTSTGWIPATAVRFVKKAGKPIQVLVRKARAKRRKK